MQLGLQRLIQDTELQRILACTQVPSGAATGLSWQEPNKQAAGILTCTAALYACPWQIGTKKAPAYLVLDPLPQLQLKQRHNLTPEP